MTLRKRRVQNSFSAYKSLWLLWRWNGAIAFNIEEQNIIEDDNTKVKRK
jgi:hypothetical protein